MIRNYIIAILVLLTLSGCTGERCIEADDFGHSIITVSARYPKSDFEGQVGANQVAPWRESGYRVNGRPLTMMVKGWDYGVDRNNGSELSAWCAWFSASGEDDKLSRFCERLQDCQFIDGRMCTRTPDAKIANAPCLFRHGVGLYALIGAKGVDPNQSLSSMRDPTGISMHLGEATSGYTLYDIDKNGKSRQAGGRVYTFASDSEKRQYNDSQLYFKILDKFYDDNSGQYKIVIKSGINRSNPDPISYVTMLVKQFLFGIQGNGEELLPGLKASNADGIFDGNGGVIKNIYMGVVNNQGYRTAVSAMLTLYIMWTALSYLAGNVQLTHTELIVRVMKIAIVSALLSSEYSWDFFNNYLFVYFVGGVQQILEMLMEAGATGPGAPGILAMMIAPQTLSKLFSLLFVDWLGWLYIILFIVALYFVVMVFFNATIIYLSALIAVGMIIVMGPIFVCFLLFGITRSLFENWLKQLISYAIQPVILFTGLIFISMIIREEIYGALGFRICKQSFPKMNTPQLIGEATRATLDFDPGDSIFYWWFPKPLKGEGFTRTPVNIPIPIDHQAQANETGDIRDGFCEAYGCIGSRYIDLPFLDPVKDQRRITQFWNGKFVQLDGLLLIFVALYLLHKFNGTAVSMARFITGTSGNYTNIQNVGDAVNAQTFAKSNAFMASIPGRIKQGAIDGIDRQIGRRALKASGADLSGKSKSEIKALEKKYGQAARNEFSPSTLFDKARIRNLKHEALKGSANKAVLAEVRKNTGLKQSDIDPKANSKYREQLTKKLVDSGIDKKDAKKLSKKLAKRNPKELNNEFARAKYGKEFSKLSDKQKASIKLMTNDRNLRKAANENEKARRFRNAYVNSYAGMSDRGIGIVGKHSSAIRSVEEIRHSAKERQRLKKEKQHQTGEEIYSAVAGVKRGAFTALGGKTQESSFGRTFAGGAYHDINSADPRRMTYAETLAENKEGFARTKLNKTIDQYNKKYGQSVTSPEFLAQAEKNGHPNLETFKTLERQEAKSRVQEALKTSEEPASYGETYLSNYAKDSEMHKLIDNSYKVQEDIFRSDEFISREAEYQTTFELAEERIKDAYAIIDKTDGYNADIPPEELLSTVQEIYEKKGRISHEQISSNMQELEQAMNDFTSSQEVLRQIDQRKVEVSEEIESHVAHINEHRTKAGMEEYHPQQPDLGVRKVRKIEDLRRG